ncbi:MAG: hypothetical protein JWN41_1046 [Thermoleophilia bacterium]|nr:hypothetical protein [Thermoleophilia bacterium]
MQAITAIPNLRTDVPPVGAAGAAGATAPTTGAIAAATNAAASNPVTSAAATAAPAGTAGAVTAAQGAAAATTTTTTTPAPEVQGFIAPPDLPDDPTTNDVLTALAHTMTDPSVTPTTAKLLFELHQKMLEAQQAMIQAAASLT